VTTEHVANAKLCRVTIHDTGIGIPEELRLKVFDPFVTTKKKGFGLGLSISYEIVVTHGGSIQLYPHETVGTVCVIEFPIQPARDAKL
jgi:signal transduction histidine kinase